MTDICFPGQINFAGLFDACVGILKHSWHNSAFVGGRLKKNKKKLQNKGFFSNLNCSIRWRESDSLPISLLFTVIHCLAAEGN